MCNMKYGVFIFFGVWQTLALIFTIFSRPRDAGRTHREGVSLLSLTSSILLGLHAPAWAHFIQSSLASSDAGLLLALLQSAQRAGLCRWLCTEANFCVRCSQQILCARTGCGAMQPVREGESLLKMSMRAGASRAIPSFKPTRPLLPSLMVRQASAKARGEHKAPVSSRGSSSPEHLTSTPHRGRP